MGSGGFKRTIKKNNKNLNKFFIQIIKKIFFYKKVIKNFLYFIETFSSIFSIEKKLLKKK